MKQPGQIRPQGQGQRQASVFCLYIPESFRLQSRKNHLYPSLILIIQQPGFCSGCFPVPTIELFQCSVFSTHPRKDENITENVLYHFVQQNLRLTYLSLSEKKTTRNKLWCIPFNAKWRGRLSQVSHPCILQNMCMLQLVFWDPGASLWRNQNQYFRSVKLWSALIPIASTRKQAHSGASRGWIETLLTTLAR